MFQAPGQCVGNERGRQEVHIGHPHGDDISSSEDFFSEIVFYATGIFPVDLRIKIPHQGFLIHPGCKDM